MIFYKMQNLQRKEALNQKVEENKPVLELKNTGKKVCQNIWKELFWFYPPCQCALMHIHMLLDHYAYVLDALMYDAYICDPWYLTMLHVCVWCTYLISMILDTWLCCMCVYDAHIYDPGPRSWSMLVCMVHISMIRLKFCHGRTNARTNKAILGVGYSIPLVSCQKR